MLPNKAQATYHEMWTKIKELKLGLTPRSMQIDFEWASRNAIYEVFPEVQLFCCFFHLGHSLWRKTQEEGLHRYCVEDENFCASNESLLALVFLPSN